MDNTAVIKNKIVENYRKGKCDHKGNTLPKHLWGRNGKGSHFGPTFNLQNSELPQVLVKLWPRDAEGNLIED
jgi:hypothetical protein